MFSFWLCFASHGEDWWIWVGECVNEQEYSGSAECSTRILEAAQNICTDSSWKASLCFDKCECWVNSIHWILSAWASIRKTMNVRWWKSEATFILGLTKKVNWSLRALWVPTSRILAGGLSDSWFCPLCPSGRVKIMWFWSSPLSRPTNNRALWSPHTPGFSCRWIVGYSSSLVEGGWIRVMSNKEPSWRRKE